MRWQALLLLAAAVGAEAAPEPSAEACLAQARQAAPLRQQITLITVAAGGERRELQARWDRLQQGGLRAFRLQIDSPAALAGSRWLWREGASAPGFWVYLPGARDRPRKVGAAGLAQSLFDTGLSPFDLKFLLDGLPAATLHALAAAEPSPGGRRQRLRLTPPSGPDQLYDRVDLLLDLDRCLVLNAELFGGVPWKQLEIDERRIERRGAGWWAPAATLQDLREQSLTYIRLTEPAGSAALPASAFDPERFHRGP